MSEEKRASRGDLEGALELGLHKPEHSVDTEVDLRSTSARRQPRNRRFESREALLLVVVRDGILELEEGTASLTTSPSRRRATRALMDGGEVVSELPFERLGRNEITAALEALDRKLTPEQHLHVVEQGKLERVHAPVAEGRVLLFVHGTFSNGKKLLEEFATSSEGRQFLGHAESTYDQVLTFDHPTLSVSPMLNARDLALLFSGSSAQVDVISHSRGGLVTRWWVEAFERRPERVRRVVFVAAPLAGTSLASPVRLRASLNLLATFGQAMSQVAGVASAGLPFLTVASGLFQIFSSMTSLAARTPVVDATLAMVPGLAAQQRVSNSAEIRSLRQSSSSRDRYFAVRGNFESEAPGWAFWKVFRGLTRRAADLATDAIFEGDNDLVVDSNSMDEFADKVRLPRSRVFDFGTTDEVHHTSYFRHPKTIEFLGKALEYRRSP